MDDSLNKLDLTKMLKAFNRDDHDLSDELLRLVYDELKRQARRFLRNERPNHTLQTTELVHEAYLQLAKQNRIEWQNRSHFFGIAGQMMRRILVKYAVKRNRLKRGGKNEDLPLEFALTIASKENDVDLIELDLALKTLEELDERQARIVELRYFSGLTIEETAEVLEVAPVTVKRDWQMAKTWLRTQISQ